MTKYQFSSMSLYIALISVLAPSLSLVAKAQDPGLREGNTLINATSMPEPSLLPPDAMALQLMKNGQAGGYQQAGQRYESLGRYPEAAEAYAKASSAYDNAKDVQQAIITGASAARNLTLIRVFESRPLNPGESLTNGPLARLEPKAGCYIGAFTDSDDNLTGRFYADNRVHVAPAAFGTAINRIHSSSFTYISYKRAMVNGDWINSSLPLEWMNRCKKDGIIPQIALEPYNLDDVQDDAFLQNFAQQLRDFNWPIFIRYGSEMNGSWTNWGASKVTPEVYKQKFRLVYSRIKSIAPNAAMIWCPNAIPKPEIPKFYPGDDACDWVGVNFYSVPYLNNDLRRDATRDSPLPYLDTIYDMYSARKPIAICEWGASRETKIGDGAKEVTDFFKRQTALLYDALPRLYPRVKMVSWFDMNALEKAAHGRKLNNYNLTGSPVISSYYRGLVEAPYYLDRAGAALPATTKYSLPLSPGVAWSDQDLEIYAKSPDLSPRVYVSLNGALVYAASGCRVHTLKLPYRRLASGKNPLRVAVYDGAGKYLGGVSTYVTRGDAPLVPVTQLAPVSAPPTTPTPPLTKKTPTPLPQPAPPVVPTPIANPPKGAPVPTSVSTDLAPFLTPVDASTNSDEVTVTVKQYLANEYGLVCAAKVQTAGSEELVFFPPAFGNAIVTAFPPGTQANVRLKQRDNGNSKNPAAPRAWDLYGVISDVVSGENSIEDVTLPDNATSIISLFGGLAALQFLPETVTGKVIASSRLDLLGSNPMSADGTQTTILFLEGRSLVYIPLPLRASLGRLTAAQTKAAAITGVRLRVSGSALNLPPGAVGIFNKCIIATSIEVLDGKRVLPWQSATAKPFRDMVALTEGKTPSIIDQSLTTPDLNTRGLTVYSGGTADMLRSGVTGKFTPAEIKKMPLSPNPTADELAMHGERPW